MTNPNEKYGFVWLPGAPGATCSETVGFGTGVPAGATRRIALPVTPTSDAVRYR